MLNDKDAKALFDKFGDSMTRRAELRKNSPFRLSLSYNPFLCGDEVKATWELTLRYKPKYGIDVHDLVWLTNNLKDMYSGLSDSVEAIITFKEDGDGMRVIIS